MKNFKILCILPILCCCSKGQGISLHPYMDKNASPAHFTICHGFSCTYQTDISIPNHEWKEIVLTFSPRPKDRIEERNKIGQAISLIETKVTEISQMNPDRAKAENFETDQDQMDCIDETINTSLYLKFLEQENVFIWHKTAEPIHRGYFVDGMWPHNSASIRELKTGDVYAVDTFYADSGKQPAIIPRDIWLNNWKPPELEL